MARVFRTIIVRALPLEVDDFVRHRVHIPNRDLLRWRRLAPVANPSVLLLHHRTRGDQLLHLNSKRTAVLGEFALCLSRAYLGR